MRLDGRRQSSNVDDRRRMGGAVGGALGIGGAIVVALITLLMGGDLGDVINIVGGEMGQSQLSEQSYTPSAEEENLVVFTKQILAGTEDVWSSEFRRLGRTYEAPKLVIFSGSVQSGCGGATSSTGPFYCSADQTVYIDLSFFTQMKRNIGADGDFAYAYVIAHEVGHHVQYLLGILDQAHQQMARSDQKTACDRRCQCPARESGGLDLRQQRDKDDGG